MVTKVQKRCSISLMIWELQVKNHNKISYLLGWQLSKKKKGDKEKCYKEYGEIRTLVCYCWESTNNMVQPRWIIVWLFLKKLNIKLPYDPAIPLLGKLKLGFLKILPLYSFFPKLARAGFLFYFIYLFIYFLHACTQITNSFRIRYFKI